MIQAEHLCKIYRTRSREVRALDDVSLEIKPGEFIVARGPSGSGKTTLLLAIGGMLRPSSGRMLIDGRDVYAMSDGDRARFRAEHVGFVFQMFHLVPYLTVVENVLLPASVPNGAEARRRASDVLVELGLGDRRDHKPSELSAGERQRVALARAMLPKPKVILADEPTGNLDPDNAAEVMKHLASFHAEGGTVVVVTHGAAADGHADRICRLESGRITQAG
ncbi:MAG: ABC transporter ATP-binding protein [Phycisphaerae bacterium]|nr:ABC transporter ATP-binding protein [Phycisphaerae bacterium]